MSSLQSKARESGVLAGRNRVKGRGLTEESRLMETWGTGRWGHAQRKAAREGGNCRETQQASSGR